MKVLIVGAGIIGSVFGWALTEGGHDVTHFVRRGKAAQFVNGMPVDMLENRKGKKNFIGKYNIKVTETLAPSDEYELVIVPTKPYQVMDVLKQIVPLTGNADYLLLTQNWNGTAEIDAVLPQSRYIYGDAHAGGIFKDGLLIGVIMNDIVLGQVNGKQDAILKKFVALFEGIQMKVVLPENILHYIWVQYAINAGLWTGLVRVGDLQKLLGDKINGPLSLLSVKECLDVAAKRGIDLKKYPESKMYMNTGSKIGAMIAGMMVRMMFKFNQSVQRASAHGLGDPTEIKEAFDSLLKTGSELGVEMPVTKSFQLDMDKFAIREEH
ncbi:MAG: 2-dehydropantoate 2-reductase N-terminal domain-containing protein [Anaerolineales bacterium]